MLVSREWGLSFLKERGSFIPRSYENCSHQTDGAESENKDFQIVVTEFLSVVNDDWETLHKYLSNGFTLKNYSQIFSVLKHN